MRFLQSLVLVLVSGCASTPYNLATREPFPPPDVSTLSTVERTGYEIYRHDQAAWVATDAALANGLTDTPAAGWITVDLGGPILVRFAGPCGDDVCSYLDVSTETIPPTVTKRLLESLPADQAGAWRARRLVAEAEFRACTPRYNTVVLPTEYGGEAAWVVYLLASSSELGEVILTGHHKFTVSFDGERILRHEPLSNSCLSSEVEDSIVSLVVSHVLHSEPIETHVFTSLNYRLPLIVIVERGAYKIEGTAVRFLGEP